MRPTDIISRVHITAVAIALGIQVRHGRCICPWRPGANGWNLGLCDEKGCWRDHVTGEGGGVLAFIERVRGCDRKSALQWLADFAGVELDGQSEAQRREWARRMREAEPEARQLVAWKVETLEALRLQRNHSLHLYHSAAKFLLAHDVDKCEARGDLRFDAALAAAWKHSHRYEALDEQIDHLASASYTDLLVKFRGAA